MARIIEGALRRPAQRRSADFQSAVSQVFNLLTFRRGNALENIGRSADYKAAIQQIDNLRYLGVGKAAASPTPSAT